MNKYLSTFANRLKETRDRKGLSLRDLERGTGISRSALSLYENCKRDPALSVVKNLAEFLNVSIDYLAGDIEDCEVNRMDIPEELKHLGVEEIGIYKEFSELDISPEILKELIEVVKAIKKQQA